MVVCVCLYIHKMNFWITKQICIKCGIYTYHGNSANLNGVFHEVLNSTFISVSVSISVLGNGWVNTFSRQAIQETEQLMGAPFRIRPVIKGEPVCR
jgi:hypothetical protein